VARSQVRSDFFCRAQVKIFAFGFLVLNKPQLTLVSLLF